MNTVTVSQELRTTVWMRILRFFRLKKKREEFELIFNAIDNGFRTGDIITTGMDNMKIIKIK